MEISEFIPFILGCAVIAVLLWEWISRNDNSPRCPNCNARYQRLRCQHCGWPSIEE